MATPYLDLFMDQNSDFLAGIEIVHVNGGDSINTYNYVVTSQIKKSYITPNVAATFTIAVANNLAGLMTMSLDRANTANLDPTRYLYDVTVREISSNSITRILEGSIYVNPGISEN